MVITEIYSIWQKDIQFVTAMAPGRNNITPRFLRHFNVVAINPFNDDTMTRIFTTLLAIYRLIALGTFTGV